MTRHILCAVDLTHDEDSRSLIGEAGRLADLEGASLGLVTVLPDYGSSFVGTFFAEGALQEAAEAAQSALRRMASEVLPERGEVQCIVEIGTAYKGVLDAAEKCGADLILVGAHKPELVDRLVGPNAARIVRHAKASVMVVRL